VSRHPKANEMRRTGRTNMASCPSRIQSVRLDSTNPFLCDCFVDSSDELSETRSKRDSARLQNEPSVTFFAHYLSTI